MAVEVSDILERFLTHEFIILVDGIILLAQGTGLLYFMRGCMMWYQLARARTSSPMLAQTFGSIPTVNHILAVLVSSAFMWKFGEGIAYWGSLFWVSPGLSFDTPYSSLMFDDISQRTANLVNVQSIGGTQPTSGAQIGVRAAFAIMSIYGIISYFRGVIYISLAANPQRSRDIKFSHIATHMVVGIFLIYLNLAYQTINNTVTASTMT
ncbi:hypothetical protein OCT63_19530 [Vibrio sp. RW]|uniref:hypothetical protein n=1 Tax=Vibrio sp. RW TaxID=2998833 RepID=UPI0022CD3B2F|nr:hypothetical protein [Vibrio sp. RW]MDA0146421.1 hypothetical protein [Vibrio sp. RW]